MGPSMILPLTKRHHPRKKAPRKRGHLASLRARRPRLPGARSQRKRPGSCTGRCKTMSGSTSNWTIIGCKKMQWCNDMINRIYIYIHTHAIYEGNGVTTHLRTTIIMVVIRLILLLMIASSHLKNTCSSSWKEKIPWRKKRWLKPPTTTFQSEHRSTIPWEKTSGFAIQYYLQFTAFHQNWSSNYEDVSGVRLIKPSSIWSDHWMRLVKW